MHPGNSQKFPMEYGASAGRWTGQKAAGPLGSGCPPETLGSHSTSNVKPAVLQGMLQVRLVMLVWPVRQLEECLSLMRQRCPVHGPEMQTAAGPELLSRRGASAPSFLPGANWACVKCVIMPPSCLGYRRSPGSPARREIMGLLGGGLFRERAWRSQGPEVSIGSHSPWGPG